MITWMQKHKKWLVVTIWISVIAFVGAGFVGWGSMDLNLNRSTSVATVGEEKITPFELEERYAQIFGYYNQISNGALSDAAAKERGLDEIALKSLVEDKLFINFAKDLGIQATSNELAITLASQAEFWDENSSFNQEKYYSLLAQNNIKPADFEKMLENQIILRKVRTFLSLPKSEDELEMLAASYFMQDVLSIEKIDYKKVAFDVNETALKELWQGHQNEFVKQRRYEISSYFLPIKKDSNESALKAFYDENSASYTDFSGAILPFELAKAGVAIDLGLKNLQKEANAIYLDLSAKKLEFQKDLNITQNDIYYPLDQLDNAKKGAVLKPFRFKQDGQEGLVILRLNTLEPERLMSFEEARELVLPLYNFEEEQKLLKSQAEQALSQFKGKNIGSVSRDTMRDPQRVGESVMNDAEFNAFLMQVFNSTQTKGYVLFDKKAILYEIKAQTLISENKLKQYKESLMDNLDELKFNELSMELSKELRQIYPVKIYYIKGNAN